MKSIAIGFAFALILGTCLGLVGQYNENADLANLSAKSHVNQLEEGGQSVSNPAPQVAEPQPERVTTQSPELIRTQELEKLLEDEKDHSAKLALNLDEKRQEIEFLESEVERLKSELTAFCSETLSGRSDWNDIKDTISSPGSEIPQEDLRDSLIQLAAKWPIQWAKMSQLDLIKIAVLYVRFNEESDAIREEWDEYEVNASEDDPERDRLWQSNRDAIFGRRNEFLYDLRGIRGGDVDDLEL